MISPDTIAAVKDRVDIVAVIGETVRLRRQGRRWVGLCPFHKEKTPSFSVNQERGFFHCFGCKEHGTAIDFVMKLEGCTFPEALRNLADRTGVDDLSSLAAMLIQTDKFGTSVAQSLRVHSETLRTKRRQRAEEAAAKTGVKMVFPLVFCIFPAIWVVTIGPAAIRFVQVLLPMTQQ